LQINGILAWDASLYGVSNEGTGRMVVLDSGAGGRDRDYFKWGSTGKSPLHPMNQASTR